MFKSDGRLGGCCGGGRGGDGGSDGRNIDLIADLCRGRRNFHMGIIS